ncbi:MAG: hypothetical protein Satyrvirus6_7 [Satyrvirus sp.]|uniref:Uncharacterized protein n=1 Tax=Satyrvirus sp. TaxID=2487771 RepID=A0A3G5AD76_9VIRU|nr:MAG: hypothetical protein Satyrvirus6_7 [Satyrvirus sp.]
MLQQNKKLIKLNTKKFFSCNLYISSVWKTVLFGKRQMESNYTTDFSNLQKYSIPVRRSVHLSKQIVQPDISAIMKMLDEIQKWYTKMNFPPKYIYVEKDLFQLNCSAPIMKILEQSTAILVLHFKIKIENIISKIQIIDSIPIKWKEICEWRKRMNYPMHIIILDRIFLFDDEIGMVSTLEKEDLSFVVCFKEKIDKIIVNVRKQYNFGLVRKMFGECKYKCTSLTCTSQTCFATPTSIFTSNCAERVRWDISEIDFLNNVSIYDTIPHGTLASSYSGMPLDKMSII